jgi:hypothetical protein
MGWFSRKVASAPEAPPDWWAAARRLGALELELEDFRAHVRRRLGRIERVQANDQADDTEEAAPADGAAAGAPRRGNVTTIGALRAQGRLPW